MGGRDVAAIADGKRGADRKILVVALAKQDELEGQGLLVGEGVPDRLRHDDFEDSGPDRGARGAIQRRAGLAPDEEAEGRAGRDTLDPRKPTDVAHDALQVARLRPARRPRGAS